MDCSALRKRNASDGDSGFDSALSSRSSSICLEDNPELNDLKISKVEESSSPPNLNQKFQQILDTNEIIFKDGLTDGLFIIRDCSSGRETQYKPPARVKFSSDSPSVEETYSKLEYNRAISVSKSHLFNSRLQLELEKQVAKMQLLEIDLLMDKNQVPPPSLGIRVIGVNMIHGVPDKLNIYVKKIVADSVAGKDGRIQPDDHIVEVNGVSLVGVSQKIASEALASCMVNPDTGFVNFVLARSLKQQKSDSDNLSQESSVTPGGETAAAEAPAAADNLLTDDCVAAEALLPHHSGTVEAFIPSAPPPALPSGDAASGAHAPSLSDLPLNVFSLLASRYLSPADRCSLAAVNKSFYQAVNKHKFILSASPPPLLPSSKLLSAKNSLDIMGAKSLSTQATPSPEEPPANLTKKPAAPTEQRRKILAAQVARQSPVPCI